MQHFSGSSTILDKFPLKKHNWFFKNICNLFLGLMMELSFFDVLGDRSVFFRRIYHPIVVIYHSISIFFHIYNIFKMLLHSKTIS